MDGAVAQLATLDPGTMIGHLVTPISAWLTSPMSAPEQLPADVNGAEALIGQLCANNGSTVSVFADYGG